MKSEMHPMDRYNRSMNRREEEFMEKLREASLRDHMDREKNHNRLYSSTHAAPGMLLGGATGLGAGTAAAMKASPLVAVPLALAGGVLGGAAGFQIGGRIRKNKEKAMSSNLKPALRELAARSEKLKEFAEARDGDGRFTSWYAVNGKRVPADVSDEDLDAQGGIAFNPARMAGAAALGGAGYGAYRADGAIMGKYGKQGLLNGLPYNYTTDSVAKTGVATRGQAYRSAFKDIGNSVTSRARQGWAAGNAAYNAAGRRASAALPVEASGFGAKLLRGIRKGLSVATKMA